MPKEKKFVIPGNLLNAVCEYLQNQKWKEVNPLLVAIQNQVDEYIEPGHDEVVEENELPVDEKKTKPAKRGRPKKE